METLYFILFIFIIIGIIYIIDGLIRIIKLFAHRNNTFKLAQVIVESSLPMTITNSSLSRKYRVSAEKRLELLRAICSRNKEYYRSDIKPTRKLIAIKFFNHSSTSLISNEYFIHNAHNMLGSVIFENCAENLTQNPEFWKKIPNKDRNEWIYWPAQLFSDKEYIKSIFHLYFDEIFEEIDLNLRMNPDFIKELLLELDSMTYPPERFLQRMFKDIEEFNFPEKFYFEIVDDINWDFITYYPKKFGLSNNLELIKKLYHKNYKILDQTTEQVRSNKSFMIQLATINITALSYIGDDLKKDTDFFL
jgi:hypothetical protein